jgi:hypothetical protein
LTPKADLNLTIKRFIALSAADKSTLRLSDVQQQPLIFKQRLWMRSPDAKLFNYLDKLPKLASFVEQYGPLKKRGLDTNQGWVIGQGFKPFHGGERGSSSAQSYESEIVAEVPYLPIEAFVPISINTRNLKPWHSSTVHRLGFERSFSGSRILFPRGVATTSMRLRASYIDAPATFQHIIQAITAPEGETERAMFICAVLNSRLAVWYAFHGTASFGSSRPEVQQAELLKLPMPEPNDLASPKRAHSIRKKLVSVVERHQESRNAILESPDADDRLLSEIDQLTYAYFGLSDDEITLIEDAVEHILPAAQPNAGSFPDLWKPAGPNEREWYAKQLIGSLADWFGKERSLSVQLIGSNLDFGILRLQLQAARGDAEAGYSESSGSSFSNALNSVSEALDHPLAQNFQTVPDLKIFVGENLYLIKPMQRRFWLRSTALVDADGIASDLETLLAAREVRSAAS